ncbi:transposase [Gordonibacter urolithinfaciens]|uniref:transposase n=1 Tax=Gordonibacter urolithinfaciens TaxID=1335613 RepID=UPI003B971852
MALFSNHNKLASFTGLAPRNRQSGASINSASSSKGGNKELKPAYLLLQFARPNSAATTSHAERGACDTTKPSKPWLERDWKLFSPSCGMLARTLRPSS